MLQEVMLHNLCLPVSHVSTMCDICTVVVYTDSYYVGRILLLSVMELYV